MRKKNIQPSGFSIMEVIIYVAVITAAMIILSDFVVDITKNAARSMVIKEVELNAQLTLNRIAMEVRHAQSIAVDSLGTQLTLTGAQGIVVLQYNNVAKTVERITAGNTESITTPEVHILSLIFTPIPLLGTTKGVAVEIAVAQGSINVPVVYKYQTELSTRVFARQLMY